MLVISGCFEEKEEPTSKVELTDEVENGDELLEKGLEEKKEAKTFSVIATNLEIPWSINKLNETFYISERNGTIVKIESGKVERQKVLLSEPLSDVNEAGLLGFILLPDFEESKNALAYYTYSYRGQPTNRIVELNLEENEWKESAILLDLIPSGAVHHGGRMKIGPDGKLYVTAGDALQSWLAQSTSNLAGKILRLNLDGTIPADNPFNNSPIYSYGHRNPQGLAWDENGILYSSEHGNNANDEINVIEPGKNYGWPEIQGNEQRNGMISPIFTSGSNETWAPSGMVYDDGNLYVATLRGTALMKFDLINRKMYKIVQDVGRIRDVWLDGDDLYFVTNNTDGRGTPASDDDKLYRYKLK